MGLLKNLFKNTSESKTDSKINWIDLSSLDQLDVIVEASFKKTIAIFKYSTRCGVSRMVLRRLEKKYDISENEPEWYFLDLIRYREVSNEISSRFSVDHESPQLILLRKGEVIYHNSHSGIDMDAVKKIAI
jgi:bacillithiol system protein YtxJ